MNLGRHMETAAQIWMHREDLNYTKATQTTPWRYRMETQKQNHTFTVRQTHIYRQENTKQTA